MFSSTARTRYPRRLGGRWRAAIRRWFPAGTEGQVAGHLYVVDPQQNLMMQYPLDPEPAPTRKDLQRLMKASRIG